MKVISVPRKWCGEHVLKRDTHLCYRSPRCLGFHGDLNETYPVGKVDEESIRVMKASRDSMMAAIALCKPGALFRDIGKAMYVCASFRLVA
jgi:methionine aminopeptidase